MIVNIPTTFNIYASAHVCVSALKRMILLMLLNLPLHQNSTLYMKKFSSFIWTTLRLADCAMVIFELVQLRQVFLLPLLESVDVIGRYDRDLGRGVLPLGFALQESLHDGHAWLVAPFVICTDDVILGTDAPEKLGVNRIFTGMIWNISEIHIDWRTADRYSWCFGCTAGCLCRNRPLTAVRFPSITSLSWS